MTTNSATTDEIPGTDATANGSHAWTTGHRSPTTFESSNHIRADDHFADSRRIVEAAVAILEQGEDLLRALSAESYTRRVPLAFNACIGGHYRHCLDHFSSLLRGLDADEVDYDHRERDARIESQPDFALALTRQMLVQLEQLPPGTLDVHVKARCEVSYAHGSSPVTGSTFGRELVYAIAHAIHHDALISIMARLMDANLPEHFGVAPSTVAHQARQQMQRSADNSEPVAAR
ncbi:MAG: hypothetical protein ABI651_21360 [Verrucomicrobiota bacterium]